MRYNLLWIGVVLYSAVLFRWGFVEGSQMIDKRGLAEDIRLVADAVNHMAQCVYDVKEDGIIIKR
jgi:hypothetical protein